jgi:hypothetical protein
MNASRECTDSDARMRAIRGSSSAFVHNFAVDDCHQYGAGEQLARVVFSPRGRIINEAPKNVTTSRPE